MFPVPPAVAGLDTPTERLAATLVAAAVLVALGVTAWRTARSAREHRDRRVVDVALGGSLLALSVAAAAALLGIWGSTPLLQAAGDLVRQHVGTVVLLAVSLATLAVVYVGTGLVYGLVHEVADRQAGVTEHQAEVVYRVLQVCIYVVAALVVLGLWDVQLGGLLVGAGFLGIVVGMAARQTLGALIAGFVLMFARPFEIGDWVEVGDQEGIVTDITVVNTRIQTFDGEYVMLPNDTVSSSEVVNRTRKGRLRLHVEVGVDYAADLDRAAALAEEAMGEVDEVMAVPQPEVVMKSFGDSAVTLDLRFWIDRPSARRKWRAQTNVIRTVKSAYDEAGVKIPFPQRELMAREEVGGFRTRDGAPAPAHAAGAESSTTGGEAQSPSESAGEDAPTAGSDGDGAPATDEDHPAAGEPPGAEDD